MRSTQVGDLISLNGKVIRIEGCLATVQLEDGQALRISVVLLQIPIIKKLVKEIMPSVIPRNPENVAEIHPSEVEKKHKKGERK